MAISYLVLGQIIPPANAATNLYTVPPYISTVVSTIAVCNQANTPTTFSLSIRPAGATVETKHYLNYNTAIAGNDTIALTLGITLATTDVVTATSASGTVSFVAFGAETGTLPVIVAPVINTIAITDSSYNTISETAIAPTGGYIKILGSGFTSGSIAYVDGVAATATTYISPAEVRVQLPAKTVGTHSLMLFTGAGLGAIYANGVVYSSVPSWTASSYSNPTTGNTVNVQLLSTGDVPLTYSLQSGSTLPTGVTLNSTGLVSGTATEITSATTVTFTVVVSDPQNQYAAPQLISLSLTFLLGKLWTWGGNPAGSLGLGNTIFRSSPVQVGALGTWNTISNSNQSSAAILADGTLWTWGIATDGQNGDGTTLSRSSPVQVGSLTTWLSLAAAGYVTAAIKKDNTLWMWGGNGYGQLGDGTVASRSSPVQVGLLTTWKSTSTSGGRYNTIAIKADGTLWTWGRNNYGQLGLGNTTNISSPQQVGALTNWLAVAGGYYHAVATKTDGTLWAWGRNNNQGQVGDGTSLSRSSPVQIGALTNWLAVSAANYHSLASKTDGTLWAWGNGSYSALGQGNTLSTSSPVQIGALTNWSAIRAFGLSSAGLKTNGTLWTWGYNVRGELGLGNTTASNSPAQVGSLTTWLAISGNGGAENMMAIAS
jgi:alpha-tubulin suppressor-like RCC1 family protein